MRESDFLPSWSGHADDSRGESRFFKLVSPETLQESSSAGTEAWTFQRRATIAAEKTLGVSTVGSS